MLAEKKGFLSIEEGVVLSSRDYKDVSRERYT